MEGRSLRRQSTHHAGIDSDEEAEIYAYKSRSGQTKRNKDYETTRKESPFLRTADGNEEELSQTPQTDLSTPPNGDGVEYEPKHPYYNYATEKSDTHADAKLIYQRHRLDTSAAQSDATSPLLMAKSVTLPPAMVDGDGSGIGPTASTISRASRTSLQNVTGPMNYVAPTSSREAFPPFEKHEKGEYGRQGPDPFLAADAQARSHGYHPGLPHEFKDSLLAREGFHGAGAGVGIGSGADGLAQSDDAVISEIEAICRKIKTVLDLRQAYLKVSLQCPGDNPKDEETWEIYPPPPEPVWTEDKVRPAPGNFEAEPGSLSNSLYMADPVSTAHSAKAGSVPSVAGSDAPMPQSPTTRKRRKAGQAIGEDFDMSECFIPGKSSLGLNFALDEGSVYQVYETDISKPIVHVPTLRDYYIALDAIGEIASDGPAKSFAYRRLQYLEGRYNLYTLLNEYQEVADTKKVPHRDFYNVRKVDTHIHHSACMNQKHLLRFIKSKMKKCPDEVVLFRDGQHLTLREVFESINLTAYDLSIDTLDMHAHTDSFHRFDKFNLKYNPIGQSRLREIFLKTDNYIQGRYLAEITREVIADLESSKYQMVEWRISIYGRNIEEWDKLAAWVVDNKLFSPNVRWLIQIPRLYAMYKATGTMDNFEAIIQNVFQPLFEVTQDPSSHPKLHVFLQRVIGFDSVDDESKIERRLFRKFPTPKEWNTKQNPPYGYWIYHLYANMTSLNTFRKKKGFNTLLMRPHCGEAGDTDHLTAAILCCHSISHGITLRKVPLLQYVFYLDQIGIAMSPLSNNALFLTYDRNPFHSYFRKGMNVSLSTDDPLQFAFTREPLIEEYSVAAQIYKFSAVDMCELAKHSVDQSGFELSLKRRWLGKYCYLPGVLGNDVAKCNVPNVREAFRHETLKAEHTL
jgi:AMP deaminase